MTLDGTRSFLVGRRRPVVIDPGPDDPAHLAALERALGGVTPEAIVLTHSHADHAGGAAALAAATGAPVLAATDAGGAGYPPELAVRWVAEGVGVETDSGLLHVLATPGHAPEHIALRWTGGDAPEGGAVFVGDLLMGSGDTTLVAPPEGDLRAYLQSLERLGALKPAVLYPAHGPPLTNPAAALRRYVAHRMERVAQVRAARAANPDLPVAELVRSIYGPALHPALAGAAEGSIRAVLAYLGESD
jgi:glyoxylase-like metal-dependent hydrolase (beta-lactamase superfamily II)